MKKHLLLLFAALLPLVASAEKVEIGGIWYNLVSKAKQAEVTFKGDSYDSYDEYSSSITIPATVTYGGVTYSVTSIGDYAFYGCSSLTAITIPEGVTSIGDGAFDGCSSLTAITIPEGVTSIGDGAFYQCSSLTAITIPEGVTSIGGSAFYSCSSLKSITIPEGVTSIRNYAFYGCTSLTDITIPESVTSIRNYAFYGCTSLTDITLPESVTSIGWSAFEGCSSLTNITIPESVKSIGGDAFAFCTSLTDITLPEGVTSIRDYAFRNCTSLIAIILPEGVTIIGSSAFYDCTSLTAITIPEGVTSIGDDAFDGCSSLTTIMLPKSVKDIYSKAFGNCPELTDVYCNAETVPWTHTVAFDGSYIEYATLHVPASAVNEYKNTAPWSSFGTIKTIENVTLEKCATPTISYKDGKIIFACDTEGATVKSNFIEKIAGDYNDMEVALTPTYTITAYATKEHYENSDPVSLTICWVPCTEEHEKDDADGILTILAKPVLIQCQGGVITLSGLDEGTEVAVYTTSGTLVATATAEGDTTHLTVPTGQVYIVKVADAVVKIGM